MPNLKCKICGTEFPPIRERHYISRDLTKTGLAAAFGSSDEPAMFDSYDCPCCGSQVIAQPRKRQYDPKSEEATDEELLADMSNETIAEHLGLNPATIGHLRAAQSSSNSSEIFKHLDALLNIDTPDGKDLKLTNPLGVEFYPMIHHIGIDVDQIKRRPSSLYFGSEDEAWAALKMMRKIVEENGFISLSEADKILGGPDRILSRWGWTDLSKAHVIQPENCSGFYISFPAICDRPEPKEGSNEL